jgi:hypothetical protein
LIVPKAVEADSLTFTSHDGASSISIVCGDDEVYLDAKTDKGAIRISAKTGRLPLVTVPHPFTWIDVPERPMEAIKPPKELESVEMHAKELATPAESVEPEPLSETTASAIVP